MQKESWESQVQIFSGLVRGLLDALPVRTELLGKDSDANTLEAKQPIVAPMGDKAARGEGKAEAPPVSKKPGDSSIALAKGDKKTFYRDTDLESFIRRLQRHMGVSGCLALNTDAEWLRCPTASGVRLYACG